MVCRSGLQPSEGERCRSMHSPRRCTRAMSAALKCERSGLSATGSSGPSPSSAALRGIAQNARTETHGRPAEPLPRGLRALAARPAGLLGRGGARDRLDREAQDHFRSQRRHLRPLVSRRRLQHLLQRRRPPCRCRARRAGGDHLRFPARRRKAHHHLSPPADRDAGARLGAARPRRRPRATASSSTCRWCRRR